MNRSTDRILTTHTGSLIRPPAIYEALAKQAQGLPHDDAGFRTTLKSEVTNIVKKQTDIGIDVPSDGEYSKRHWVHYVTEQIGRAHV